MSEFSLVPVETLSRVKDALVARIAQSTPHIELDAGDVGDALAWSLLFEHWPDLVGVDREAAFYNRYFWFKRFATLKQQKDGYDAGLEQQVFKLLEHPDVEVDWELMERLDHEAANVPG